MILKEQWSEIQYNYANNKIKISKKSYHLKIVAGNTDLQGFAIDMIQILEFGFSVNS